MKLDRSLLAGTALATMALGYAGRANAATACAGTFTYTGGLQSCTVAQSGRYTISALGGAGGDGYGSYGGGGASVTASFYFEVGQEFSIIVGGAGTTAYYFDSPQTGSGGGGSFVIDTSRTRPRAVIVAGGGGGGGGQYNSYYGYAYYGDDGGDAGSSRGGDGSNGYTYMDIYTFGTGGTGFNAYRDALAAGTQPRSSTFGGGGAGNYYAGGGGGGFTGGDGGFFTLDGGEGGSSFLSRRDRFKRSESYRTGVSGGAGRVDFRFDGASEPPAVPLPASLGFLLGGAGALGAASALKRRRRDLDQDS
jgi:hypothetical protein